MTGARPVFSYDVVQAATAGGLRPSGPGRARAHRPPGDREGRARSTRAPIRCPTGSTTAGGG